MPVLGGTCRSIGLPPKSSRPDILETTGGWSNDCYWGVVLRQLGVDRRETMEAVMMAALANFVNTWADVSSILIDQEEESE